MSMPRFYVGPRWPASIAAYDYALTLSPSDLAWEFLRRNAQYQRAYRLSRRGSERPGRLRGGHPIVRVRRRTVRSIAWGLNTFVDPALPAPEAPLCWLACSTAPILEALCCRAPGSTFDLAIANLRSAKGVIVGPGREEYVLLGDSDFSFTLRLRGSRAICGPVCTTFLLRGIPDATKLAADFATFGVLLHAPMQRGHRSHHRLLLRDALVALDARCIGASHRDVAELIFGGERVREAWSGRGGWLKERVRRAIATGEMLRDGGYRGALEGSCRFAR
jgi:hypothetical protein